MAKPYNPDADYNKDKKVSPKEQARYDKNQRAEFMALLPAQYEMLPITSPSAEMPRARLISVFIVVLS